MRDLSLNFTTECLVFMQVVVVVAVVVVIGVRAQVCLSFTYVPCDK